MAIKFFGHYLLDEGVLTKEQLLETVSYQSEHNLSLGEWAVKEGYINEKEAQRINDHQRMWDKRFGEVALELNLLTDEQIDSLLKTQRKNKKFFGEVVILKGFLTQEELDKQLSLYENKQTSENQTLDQKLDEIENNSLLKEALSVFETLYYRIMRDNIKLTDIHISGNLDLKGTVALQSMRGDEDLDFAIVADDNSAMHIASTLLKMQFKSVDEDVKDVVSEFVNIILGNIAVKLSSQDKVVDLTPPTILNSSEFSTSEYICFNFLATKGKLTICLNK